MVKKISLARKKAEGRTVLLAGSRNGEAGYLGSYRNKRKKKDTTAKRKEEKASSLIAEESENTTKAKDGDERPKRRGRKRGYHYTARKPTGEAKGKDSPSGRSAAELGIVWVDARCELSPTKAHHMIGKFHIDKGVLYECKYCHRVRWQPFSLTAAVRFGSLMRIYGEDEGYRRALNHHPAARRLIAKLQDLYLLRASMPEEQYLIVLAAIMTDKEYPYKEVTNG